MKSRDDDLRAVNMGGTDFWTRFFTFAQNSETDFIWAFLTKLGIDLGATGAAFAMSAPGGAGRTRGFQQLLLEDMHLGMQFTRWDINLCWGPS